MLADLHEVAIESRQRFNDEFTPTEIVLSEPFKNAFSQCASNDGQTVAFLAHSAVVTTSDNKKIYIPNQWFRMASFMVDFTELLYQYSRTVVAILSRQIGAARERNDFIDNLKAGNAQSKASFIEWTDSYLRAEYPVQEDRELVSSRLIRFATDYNWWFGNKSIHRTDFYLSPILLLLGVVAQSQGHIADICVKMANYPELKVAAESMIDNTREADEGAVAVQQQQADTDRITGGINEIVYGAPGTGKSFYLENEFARRTITTRVVFHPEYSVFDFIGTYKPFPVYEGTDENANITELDGTPVTQGKPLIDYRFVPGPFISSVVDAWLHPDQMYTLLIEEINRANAASVFGEMFQLLDRDIRGESEYRIKPAYDLNLYLQSVPGMQNYLVGGLGIPSNLNIVATMNSADQGVMPMDTAFKRRWSFVYMKINIENAMHGQSYLHYANQDVTWGSFVTALNRKLMDLGVEEDRLIGPYFIKPVELGSRKATDKLLLYLWDDVLRHQRESFFNNTISTFAELSELFDTQDVFDLMADQQYALLLQVRDTEHTETDQEENDTEGEGTDA